MSFYPSFLSPRSEKVYWRATTAIVLVIFTSLFIPQSWQRLLWIALATGFIALAIGVLDEVLQAFLPQRVFAMEDIVFNSLAVFTTLTLQALGGWVKGLRS